MKKKGLWLLIGLLIILSITGLILISIKKRQSTASFTKKTVLPSITPIKITRGELSLVKINKNSYQVVVDSQNLNIVSYDFLIKFDKQKTTISSIISANPDFTIFKMKRENLYVVTGVKKLAIKKPTILNNSKMLTISLKSAENQPISIIGQAGKEKTSLVDSNSKISYPKILK